MLQQRFHYSYDVVSHHSVLQVHPGPTGEEQLYHISVTSDTGHSEDSSAALRIEQNETNRCDEQQGNNGKCTLAIRYSMSEANDTTGVVCLLPASLHVHACTSNACS